MSKVAIVTDSTVNIPADLARGCPIHIAPLQVIWGSETYRDGVDIHPGEFYQRLKNEKVSPTTSQPSPAVFHEMYKSLLDQGYEIFKCPCYRKTLRHNGFGHASAARIPWCKN